MKRTTRLGALCVAGSLALVGAAAAQDSTTQNQEVTQQTTTTQIKTIEGKVVRYEPGRTIVIAGPDNKEVTYTLSTTANVPADVEVGRVVSLSTEPSANGPATVSRVTVRSVTADGQMKTETQTRSTDASGNQTTTNETSVTGTVSAFEPGQSLTIQLPDGKTAVYMLNPASVVPPDVAVGKTYTIQTTRTSANGPIVVKKITTTTTTKKTTHP
jgi:hypothetical protein